MPDLKLLKECEPHLWYYHPASKFNAALPMENGRIGAMIFGRTDHEQIQLNEESLWAGGPQIYLSMVQSLQGSDPLTLRIDPQDQVTARVGPDAKIKLNKQEEVHSLNTQTSAHYELAFSS